MDSWEIIYHFLLLAALFVSLLVFKSENKSLRLFPLILLIGNVIEIIVIIEKGKGNTNYPFFYHFYIPIEYVVLALFYYLNSERKWVKKSILVSIPIYILICIWLTNSALSREEYPSLQFNLEGVLLIVLAISNLFSLKGEEDLIITRHPLFWIDLAMLLFYTGNFFLMGSYNQLISSNPEIAKQYFKFINNSLNYSLYILFIIAFICSRPVKKS